MGINRQVRYLRSLKLRDGTDSGWMPGMLVAQKRLGMGGAKGEMVIDGRRLVASAIPICGCCKTRSVTARAFFVTHAT